MTAIGKASVIEHGSLCLSYLICISILTAFAYAPNVCLDLWNYNYSYEPQCGRWEWNLRPLQKKRALLNPESFLQLEHYEKWPRG